MLNLNIDDGVIWHQYIFHIPHIYNSSKHIQISEISEMIGNL